MADFDSHADLTVHGGPVRLTDGTATPGFDRIIARAKHRHGATDPAAIAAAHPATPDSRMLTIPDAGHIVSYDRPEELGTAIREFFAAVLQGR